VKSVSVLLSPVRVTRRINAFEFEFVLNHPWRITAKQPYNKTRTPSLATPLRIINLWLYGSQQQTKNSVLVCWVV